MTSPVTCPRCLHTQPRSASLRFCPRCGLQDVVRAADDRTPSDITAEGQSYRIVERLAAGSISTIYRCRFHDGRSQVEGTAKIVRDGRSNGLLQAEAATLRRLFAADPTHRYKPFLPFPQQEFTLTAAPGQAPRQGTILRTHPEIRSPADELYTLTDVRACYPAGLDPRHAAWIWRRILSVLGFIHEQGIVHGAVLPDHVLIEPKEHKLVLIDWCCAVPLLGSQPVRMLSPRHDAWYRRELACRQPPSAGLDIALAARTMAEVMGGDSVAMTLPPTVDAALVRYFGRCVNFSATARPQAWELLQDFDRLIEALWGRRRFVALSMPPKLPR